MNVHSDDTPVLCVQESLPFAVVGTDKEHQVNGNKVLGRKTKWGIIEGKASPFVPLQLPPSPPTTCVCAYCMDAQNKSSIECINSHFNNMT